ncbi:MAG: M3 family metallopeptidase [Bacteroidales bacterium]|nr:M3 family metallopeptidase [Bacteroidales bacterium]
MKNLFVIMLIVALPLASCSFNTEKDLSELDNPFFSEYDTPFEVPPFELIEPEHYIPAFEKGMLDHKAEIEKLVNSRKEPTFENTIEAYDRSGELLGKVASVFFSQTSANTNKSLQEIQMQISPQLSAHSDAINLNPMLFDRIKSVYENRKKNSLSDEQLFLLENFYKGFVRNGANLNESDQEILKDLNQKLSVLSVQFDQNLLAETNSYKMIVEDEIDLAGLPESVIGAASEAAQKAGLDGKWIFTTQKPSMLPFLQSAENRELRKKLYYAYTHRGNNGNEYDNNEVLAEIVSLRAKRAKLLGYETHSHITLEPRMAKNPDNVMALLNQLWEASIPVAVQESDEMQEIIDREGGKFKLAPYDWWFYSEKLRKEKYDLDDNELRPYFKLENVRDGAFTVANKLFGITFNRLEDIPLPHPEAQAFEVKEADGSHIGVLYMDFHPRDSKQHGAWCGGYREYHLEDGEPIRPVTTLVCNFTRASGETPSLLSMDEVSTLFHEFGHALDGLFAKNTYEMAFIAWDFVELPSQIMEHWVTEPEVLDMYARHYQTGEVIPDELVTKIKNSSYFNQGFVTVEYLAASMLDIAYHTQKDPVDIDVATFEKEYFDEIGLMPEILSRYHGTYFAHIAGGYDSGYYSYIWAGVLDNDAFEAFKEKGIFDQATAQSYRENILERNGTMNSMEMYVNFRGSEPKIDPLLKNRGLDNN